MIRVQLPTHLRELARTERDVFVEVIGPVTQATILAAIEARYPALEGTMRDHFTRVRRPLVRFFCCGEDVSFEPPDAPLPDAVAAGKEPFIVIGAIAGGSNG